MPTGIYKRTKEHREKISNAMKGRPQSLSGRLATLKNGFNTRFQKGNPSVFKGHTHTAEAKLKNSLAKKGIQVAWNKGLTKETEPRLMKLSQSNSIAQSRLWQNEEYAKKQFKAIVKNPNQEERYVDAILQLNFPKEWKYVGDGEFLIGKKNPDFINTSNIFRLKAIEYNGFTTRHNQYGHTKEKDEAKTEYYREHGWETVNLYQKDLSEYAIKNKVKTT